jgi:hypothetical protein
MAERNILGLGLGQDGGNIFRVHVAIKRLPPLAHRCAAVRIKGQPGILQ